MGIVGGFILVFCVPPVALAFLLGGLFPHRWVLGAAASVLALALLLILSAGASFSEMVPFTALLGAILLPPAIVASLIGSRIRFRLTKET